MSRTLSDTDTLMCCRLLGKSNQLTFANLSGLLKQFAAVSPEKRDVAENIERLMNGQCLMDNEVPCRLRHYAAALNKQICS